MLKILLYLSQVIEQVISGEVTHAEMNDRYIDIIVDERLITSDLFLTQLPADILCYLAVFLQPKDIVSLGRTCKAIHSLYKSDSRSVYAANHLLTDVIQGRQEKVENFLLTCSLPLCQRLLQTKINFISAGIRFNGITAFQYALWARDWHMYTMLNSFITPDNAKQQMLEWNLRELQLGSYSLDPMIKAYTVFVAYYHVRDHTTALGVTSAKINQFDILLDAIGTLQKLAPAHILQQYFHSEGSWHVLPEFEKRNKLIRCDLTMYSSNMSHLGNHCVLTRGVYAKAYFTGKSINPIKRYLFAEFNDDIRIENFSFYNATYDLHALMALNKALCMKYDEFKTNLLFVQGVRASASSTGVAASASLAGVAASTSSTAEPEESDARRAARYC